jgi:hypothetical protein
MNNNPYPAYFIGIILAALANSWLRADEPKVAVSPPPDAIQDAQAQLPVTNNRPELKKNKHDNSDVFDAANADPSSGAFENQPERGETLGFDFYRDPLDAQKPMQTFEATLKADIQAKTKVMETQRKLLESRYNLTPRLDSEAKMFRGKPLAVGPTAKLAKGLDWERLAKMAPQEIKKAGIFPYPSLPHPKQQPGGQVFPQVQIAMHFSPNFPRRFSCKAGPNWAMCREGKLCLSILLSALQGYFYSRSA